MCQDRWSIKTWKVWTSLSSEIEQRIQELNLQLAKARQERDQLSQEARKWAEKRNEYHEQIRQLQNEVKNLREKRDETNLQVQILKATREKAKSQRKERQGQAAKLKEKMKSLTEQKPSARSDELDRQIQSLEWKIQTSSLSIKDEKELVEQVRTLETQRAASKQLHNLKNSLLELQAEAKTFGTQAKLEHEKLSQQADQSQEFHQKALETSNRIRTVRQSADEAHQKYSELRQKADRAHEKFLEIQQQARSLKEELEMKAKQRYVEKEQALRTEATAKAKEKMKRGEKLTWNEFKLLSEQEESTEH